MTAVYGLTVVHDFVCLLSVKKQKHAFFLFCSMLSGSIFSINLLAFYHKCRALIGYATHYYQNQYSGKTALGILAGEELMQVTSANPTTQTSDLNLDTLATATREKFDLKFEKS